MTPITALGGGPYYERRPAVRAWQYRQNAPSELIETMIPYTRFEMTWDSFTLLNVPQHERLTVHDREWLVCDGAKWWTMTNEDFVATYEVAP